MNRYDPSRDANAEEWLALDEQERTLLVEAYHRRVRVSLPNPKLHAIVHTIVENQLAENEATVVATLKRLRNEGLDRHEAIHAIGSVLVERLHSAINDPAAPGRLDDRYRESLGKLTARAWREG